MLSKDYYEVLEISSNASQEAIKDQYRFLLHAWHPDKFPNLQQKMRAQERTKEINEAYSVLGESEQRARYDAQRSEERTDAKRQSRQYEQQPEWLRQEQTQTQQNATPFSNSNNSSIPLDFPVTCQRCGGSDSSLRWAAFPFVVSIIILTFRRGWNGLYCVSCRRKEMLKAKLLTLFFGWWGFPWGIFYSLGALLKSDEGEVPAELNADYLKGLGAYFLQAGQVGEALIAFNTSLQLKSDPRLGQMVKEIFGSSATTPLAVKAHKGLGFTQVFIGLIVLFVIGSIIAPTLGINAVSREVPSNNKIAITSKPTALPPVLTATSTAPTPTPAPPPKDWKKYKSADAHFAAYIPDKWVPRVEPPQKDRPAHGVSFAPSAALQGEDATVISVTSVPIADVQGAQPMSSDELKESAADWLKQRDLKVIKLPVELEVNGQAAVWMVHELEFKDKQTTLRGYAAMISTSEWFYYIEVAGIADYDPVIQSYFDKFIQHFDPAAK